MKFINKLKKKLSYIIHPNKIEEDQPFIKTLIINENYIELRKGNIKAGICVYKAKDDNVIESSERLQENTYVVADILELDLNNLGEYKVPIIIKGKVLAYFGGEKSDYEIGDAICAGQFGRIWKMTEEEILQYPDRILGYITEAPEWAKKSTENDRKIWVEIR